MPFLLKALLEVVVTLFLKTKDCGEKEKKGASASDRKKDKKV
jgi:hypothetical protein